MNDQIRKWLWTGGGIALALTVLSYAGRYLVAQEAEKVVAPVRMEQQATSKIIAQIQFEARYDEAQKALAECREQEHSERYCEAQDKWRWEVYYPYLDCIAGLEYRDREDTCGPVPNPPEETEP